jgi:hypothetical protein
MFYPPELLSWVEEVSTHLPHLSRAQAQMLAWYSFAVTVVQRSGMSHVAYFLACLLDQNENTVRQRLRESVYETQAKRGTYRRELEVSPCFMPLLKWALRLWHSEDKVLVLALDATTLRQTFTVLSLSLLIGRCALPLAWVVLPATQPGSWKPHWQDLLRQVSLPTPELCVLVAADRGLYAKWLFEAIVACGWHPLLRINAQGACCVHASGQRIALATLAALCKQRCWHGAVTCFSDQARLTCTLLAMWDETQQEAWLLLTDLPPPRVSPTWYSLRMWIEAGFKALKSAGFHWDYTRMTHPARAQRLWLVLALAALRACSLAPPAAFTLNYTASPPRLSLLKQGCLRQLAALILARPLLPSPLFMQPLPPAPCLEFLNLLKTYP